ncbi:bacillithiol system redox-active protein YtxJ [Pedobacter sp. LMG 31464]|uniref:Bacillithiol system redox-active protein YtxJ n=1 Tax=Pedobacter planticolens TaxID=2679964 RepID=A0A923DX61_9SPHI|nr:bacillithiol system redox-active protein YtxJ [Pedobacter planticolens]MBB2145637.1 bacillithiol system redox-active protein YtxJ [Pedobacter planticolens]
MHWISLNTPEQVKLIKEANGYSLIFKHSTRCSISLMAKKHFELDWETIPENTPLYFLDLIAHRDISALIAETFQVHHESPQVLLIKDGECVLDLSHSDISAEEIVESITA